MKDANDRRNARNLMSEKSLFSSFGLLVTIYVNNLKQSFVLLGVARNFAVEIGNKFDGPFSRVIDRREAVDQFPKVLEIFDFLPLHCRSSKEIGVEVAEL